MEHELITVVNNLRAKFDGIRTAELKRISRKVSAETYEIADAVTHCLVGVILHNLITPMQTSAPGETRKRLVESVDRLFVADLVTSGKE